MGYFCEIQVQINKDVPAKEFKVLWMLLHAIQYPVEAEYPIYFNLHLLNQVVKWKTFILLQILMIFLFRAFAFLNTPIFLNCFCPVSLGLVLGRNTTLANAQRSSDLFLSFFFSSRTWLQSCVQALA